MVLSGIEFRKYDDNYYVSADGEIYSVYLGRCLKHGIDHDGYHRVDIHGAHMKVHKLVYLTWYGDIPEGKQINHVDDNKDNNSYYNLYLGDQLENIADCIMNEHRSFTSSPEHVLPITVVDDGTSTNETRLGAVKDIRFAVEARGIVDDALVIAGDNLLDFSLVPFIRFGQESGCSCIMCYEEDELAKQQQTAIITVDEANTITSYDEKPREPKSNLAVPPFYYYRNEDLRRILEALEAGCGYDAPGSFAVWLSKQTQMKAWRMPGKRYDIGNLESYRVVKNSYQGIIH